MGDELLWCRAVTLHGLIEHQLATILQRRHGLGLSDYRALCYLAEAVDGELRMQELAELLALNQSSVSRLVARLESAGLTRRAHCDDDRRGVYSVITEEGRARQAEVQPVYAAALKAALDKAASHEEVGDIVTALRGGVA